jgi:hypothetical protein
MTRILRQLSAIYLTAASAFVAMAVFAQHPDWSRSAREAGLTAKSYVLAAAGAANEHIVKPGYAYARDQGTEVMKRANIQPSPAAQVAKKQLPKPGPVQLVNNNPPPRVARPQKSKPAEPELSKPAAVLRDAPQPATTQEAIGNIEPLRSTSVEQGKAEVLASAKTQLQFVPPDAEIRPLASRAGLGPGELVRVAQRLKSSLSQDLFNNFELFLYVSKADIGSWSQRMYVFAKQPGGDLDLLYNWPVSTGREKWELDVHGKKENSFTPQGFYELDSNRMWVRYHSGQWNQPMPYAMFFNWEQNGYQTGLAIHGAAGEDTALLGQRASAGCIRLAPENARLLFNLIKTQYKGLAPKFAYDRRTATMDNNGLLLHDKSGKIVFDSGYKVLVFVENYGGNDMVAALY